MKSISCRRSALNGIDRADLSFIMGLTGLEGLSFNDGRPVPETIRTEAGLQWNDRGLLAFFRGRFITLRGETILPPGVLEQKTKHLWEKSDVFELFVGPGAAESRMYKEFQVAPNGEWIDIDVFLALGTSNHDWYSGCAMRSFVDEGERRWCAVMELPWTCFGARPETERPWYVNFYRASGAFHGDELLAWSPVGTGPKCFHRPEHFGRIEFIE
ncbi:MAG: hypothetical protein F9K22_01660 [Bacteroidetes bacterium]|nr:MAG: hypothetical protein F9K22_01660 [Bacteroidota bacterium]